MMETVADSKVKGARTVDGKRFQNCDLSEAVLNYRGGAATEFVDCTGLDTAKFKVNGRAASYEDFVKAVLS